MFFFLSKTLGWLLTPTNLIATLAALGLICLCTRFARLGRRLTIAATVLLVACSFLPIGYWLIVPIEQRFPAWNPASGPPNGIVVLGGSIAPDISDARGIGVFPNAADRLVA